MMPITIGADFVPFLSPERYAERMGVDLSTVKTMMDNGLLPVYQPVARGNRYINMIGAIKLADEVYETQKRTAPWATLNGIR
ncbi:hypothetical protein [Shewanella sp. SM74]|uniref:hypothetical protein n=1 Tax=Shewanella sp. SM74 TaxID=2912807 RepID=UPI0021DA7EE7|nr:hypothetical protein [Shewanella sp. SM74]MCU8013669.1 hypothetical protein [Shewanella sp. SM74]